MKSLVFDIETDGLQPTKIYCMSVLDVDSQEQFNFKPDNIVEGINLLESADKLIGHNIIGFDIPVIRRLHNVDLINKGFPLNPPTSFLFLEIKVLGLLIVELHYFSF